MSRIEDNKKINTFKFKFQIKNRELPSLRNLDEVLSDILTASQDFMRNQKVRIVMMLYEEKCFLYRCDVICFTTNKILIN